MTHVKLCSLKKRKSVFIMVSLSLSVFRGITCEIQSLLCSVKDTFTVHIQHWLCHMVINSSGVALMMCV